jgi:hypothetical protein
LLTLETLSPDAPMVVNGNGGKQSAIDCALDQYDPNVMLRGGMILDQGANKYGRDNWRRISKREHLNHALVHIYGELSGDDQDDHLGHAFIRLMMAYAVELQGGALTDADFADAFGDDQG